MRAERAEPAAAPDLPAQLQRQLVALLYEHVPLAMVTTILVACALGWFLWDIVPREGLRVWLALAVGLALLRLGLVAGYRRRAADPRLPWHHLMTAATLCSGLVWGAAGWLFFVADSSPALIFVTIILAGMAAGSMASHSSWLPAQLAYAIPAMTPISLRYLSEGGELRILGLMCLFYLFNIVTFARHLSGSVRESIQLRLERQELVQQLRQEKLVAEQANLAKSRFLAAASHDLRQPLHAVNLFVEALRHEREPGRAAQVLDHLGASAQSLEDLLNELLDISKLEAGLFKPQTRVFPLQPLLEGLWRELQPVAEAKGIELGFVPTRVQVHSDPAMLARMLRNLIANAIRYTEQGAVLVGCRRQGGRVAVAVYDTGPGIAPEHHEAIFREFYQLGNPERDRRKGLGLGLAIVQGLGRVLDHPVLLQSRVGHGSMFAVSVPVAQAGAEPVLQAAEAAVAELPPCDVLVIDDEAPIRQAMTEVLRCWGCRVLTAESADEALQGLAREGFVPDVVIADYRLAQGRTGAEAIAQVRQALGREVPAALLTGDTAPERLREASASGCLLLHKPLQPARLRAALLALGGGPEAVGDLAGPPA